MTLGSLFAGVGGFDCAASRIGIDHAWQVEIDRQCRSVLERHFPNVQRVADVNAARAIIEPKNHARIATRLIRPDILCGGFPCQDLSVAGQRAGLAGSRSGLWFVFRRIIAVLRPDWVCIENVPGLRSSNGGRDLGAIVGALGQLGYGWAYRSLDAQYFGLAQRRERVFIVGSLGNWRRAGEILFESESVSGDHPPRRETRERVAATITAGVASGRGVNRPGRRREDDVNLVSFTNRGFDAGDVTETIRAGSHGATPMVARCLTAGEGTRQDGESVNMIPVGTFQNTGHGWWNESPVAATVRTPDGGGFSDANIIAHTLPGHHQRNDADTVENLLPVVVGTLCSTHTPNGHGGRGISNQAARLTSCEGGTHADSKPHVAGAFGVRRLTPLECERLQGFPDNWTSYAADGSELSDSARYRMLGNAVAVPVVEWILKRIAANGGH